MTKLLLFVLIFILVQNVFIQTAPLTVDENEDIISTLARLHEETERIRRRFNPMPDLITFASNDVGDRLKRYIDTKTPESDGDTVYVNMKVDSEEDLETKYVNLYIDTGRNVNARYINLDRASDPIDDKFVYLNVKPAVNDEPLPPYRRFRRQR